MKKPLDFSQNWNGKLNCSIFHTLRATGRFDIGDKVEITIKGELLGSAECISKTRYENMNNIPEIICLIDTGYSKDETLIILGKMYGTDEPQIMPIYGYLFKWIQTTANKKNLKPVIQLAMNL